MYFQGSGTRTGNGKCDCDYGYHEDKCNECSDRFYVDGNQTSMKRTKLSCKPNLHNELYRTFALYCNNPKPRQLESYKTWQFLFLELIC